MGTTPHVVSIEGTVKQFTLSPKGVPEGLIVAHDAPGGGRSRATRISQANFDPQLAGQVTSLVSPGVKVALDVVPSQGPASTAHVVYDLVRLTTTQGGTLVADGPGEAEAAVRGKIVRLNYARRGEVNGVVLDTGDFVHLRPHGAKLIDLAIDQPLEATGEVRAGWSGLRVLEARTVNGLDIPKPPKPHHPKPHERRPA